ncbi:hypothetical protein [Vibrio sp. OPT18]|uniref:hypothetical protein n=1 Tax=Vibrio sp. OPT18 TaxID=2778641 RepID=UPI0018824209|nr:hypothetical protein [Vibrio sp. OPT18]MBE8574145.1 hypothetical protein [Vibrio sp. OPT18]
MGRKSRKKKIDRMWNDCLEKSKKATDEQLHEASVIFEKLNNCYPIKRSLQYSKALNRVFDDYGDLIGSLVMVEFAKDNGFI